VNAPRHLRVDVGPVSQPRHRVTTMTTARRRQVIRRPDGRYEVCCKECEQREVQTRPIGIGVPIASRFEAESIWRNHGRRLT